jgi:hypothetical protein
MQADQFQTRLIRDREGCKNEWHVVVKSGAACAGCDVPAKSRQKPWPGSSPSAKTSSDNHHENLVMSAKNPVGDNDKATAVVADAAVVADDWKETLKRIGGSQSDDWNQVLGNQAIQSLWIKQSDMEVRQRQSFGLEVPTGEESG